MKRYGVLHPYPLPSLWRSSPGWLRNFPGLITASRFLWDFCKIPQKSSFFVIFWAGDDSRRLRDAAPDRSFILRFLKILIDFIIDLSFLEIKEYSVTFFAAFREGQFLRKESRSRIFQKILRRSQESARCPWCGPTVGLFIYSLNWDRNASCRLRDALGGDTRNECF